MIWGQAVKNWGQAATSKAAWGAAGRGAWSGTKGLATGRFGATATGAFYGGAAGGAWGMASEDTSVLGGMMMGAGMGAAGGRYGGAAVRGVMRANRAAAKIGAPRWPASQLARRAGGAAWGQIKRDALLVSNKASNGFSAMKSRVMESPLANAYGHMF